MANELEQQVARNQVVLKKRLTALVEDAQSERTAGNASKVLGLTSLALGGLAAVTTGGLATVPIGVGLVAYLSAVVGQAKKTGRVMPLPFNDTSTTELLGGVAGAPLELPELEDYAYMSTQQKAEYAMILCCGSRIATALAQMPSDQHRQFAYAVAKRRFMQMYGQHIKETPELLMAVDAGEVAEYILAGEDDFKRLRAEMQRQALPEPAQPAEPSPTAERASIGSNTRLGAIAVPAQAVGPQPSAQQWDEDEPLEATQGADDLARLRDALGYPAVLIFGASGAGKSTMAQWFVYERLKLGHGVEILDPHVAYGQWKGLPVYGAGLDYAACDERLGAFADLVQSRYQTLAKKPNFNPRPHTLLTEEFTQWATHCSRAAGFFSSSMSDLRKVNMYALYVAHGKTLKALGGSSGTAQQRDASLLMIELDAKMGPDGQPVPAGRGRIYYPGRHDSPVEIVVPNLAIAAQPAVTPAPQQRPSSNLEMAYSADSSDEVIALVTEVLQTANEPLLASVIRQKKNQLKERFTKEELEGKLRLLAMEGFVQSTGTEPPRYTLP